MLIDDDHGEFLHVGLDGRGKVMALERRLSPGRYAGFGQSYASAAALAAALRTGGSVRSLAWVPGRVGAAPSRVATLNGQRSFAIDLDAFAGASDDEWGRGC